MAMRLFQDIKEVESYIQEKDEHFRLKIMTSKALLQVLPFGVMNYRLF